MFTYALIAAIAVFAMLAVWLALESPVRFSRNHRQLRLNRFAVGCLSAILKPLTVDPMLSAYLHASGQGREGIAKRTARTTSKRARYFRGVRRALREVGLAAMWDAIRSPGLARAIAFPIAGGAPEIAELRTAVKDALERMQKAHKELEEAEEDADTEALTRTFDEAETAHGDAVKRLERAERMKEALDDAPIDPVEDDPDPDDPNPDDSNPEDTSDRTRRARVKKEPLTYERGNGRSVFADLAKVQINQDPAAAERISSHRKEMEVEQRAHPGQTIGEGGEFIAPIWMQDEWIKLPRAGRAIADSLNRKPHPGTNQVNLPKLASGSATARQAADGEAVKSTDVTTSSVTGQTQTIAGQQDVAIQLVDLSNPGMDEVLFDDLGRDYNQRVDLMVIESSVTNAKGLLQLTGTNTIAYTDASPTVAELYPKFAAAIAEVNEGIFVPPTVIAMTPRRWGWISSATDSQGRPLVTPYSGMNVAARIDKVAAEAVVGEIQGLPVIIDANLPKNEGGGTNQDSILVYNADAVYLFEDETPNLRVLKEVLSGNLQIRFQLYNYVMLIAGRLPKAISKIQGTGLVTPAF